MGPTPDLLSPDLEFSQVPRCACWKLGSSALEQCFLSEESFFPTQS